MARIAFILLLACLVVGNSPATTPVVDMYLDAEIGSAGANISPSLLSASTHGNVGTWSLWPESAQFLSSFEVANLFDQNVGQVIVGGTTYTDNGFRSFAFRNTTDEQFARYTFTTKHSKVSLGCYLRLGDFRGTTFGSYDLIAMEGDDGDFVVLNFEDYSNEEVKKLVWQVHTHTGIGVPTSIQANKTYWVTMLYDQPNQRGVLKVYDANTWDLLGTSTKTLEAAPCEAICFGRYDAHGYFTTAFHYYDDLMVDFTHATFPLLPASMAAPQLPLSLSINGAGIVSGPGDEALLEVGKSYTTIAKPAPGNLFAGWSGSVNSSSAKLHFVMESNLTLTASFVSNHFQHVKGTYNGLFYNSSDPQQASSGYATMTVNSVGTYSGKLTLNAKSYGFHGTLAPDSGTAEQVILRPGTNALRLQLSLDLDNDTDRLTGIVSEETSNAVTLWSAALSLDRATFSALNPAPNAGRYTLYIPPDSLGTSGPMGDSVGTLTLSASGALTASWALADGTKTTRKTTLSKTGRWPLYAPLYKDKGSLLSPVQFDTNQQNTDLAGPVVWFKQAQPAKHYPEGFTNSMSLRGSRYLATAPIQPAVNATTATLVFSNPELPADFTNEVALSPGAIVNHGTNKLSISLSKSSGLFQGTVTPPTGGKALVLKGVLFQKQSFGAGFVIGTNQSGLMLLTPETP